MVRAGSAPERLTLAGAEVADDVGFDRKTVSTLTRRFDVKVASPRSRLKRMPAATTPGASWRLRRRPTQARHRDGRAPAPGYVTHR
jgi:predicted ATPase with chaperone activity